MDEDIKEKKEHAYSKILQAKGTNAVAHSSYKRFTIDKMSDVAILKNKGVLITMENYQNSKLNILTLRVLDILIMKLTKEIPYKCISEEKFLHCRNVELSVKEFMDISGLKDRKEATKQLNEAVNSIFNIYLECEDGKIDVPNGKPKRFKWQIRILESICTEIGHLPVKNGKVSVIFTMTIAQYLSQKYIMPYPNKLLTINARQNPLSYYLGRVLAEHHNMNRSKENSNRISVRTLMKACPDLPTYEEIFSDSRQVSKRIIKPLERDLNALRDKYAVLSDWRYCNSIDDQKENDEKQKLNYHEWEKQIVEFHLADYPKSKSLKKKLILHEILE